MKTDRDNTPTTTDSKTLASVLFSTLSAAAMGAVMLIYKRRSKEDNNPKFQQLKKTTTSDVYRDDSDLGYC